MGVGYSVVRRRSHPRRSRVSDEGRATRQQGSRVPFAFDLGAATGRHVPRLDATIGVVRAGRTDPVASKEVEHYGAAVVGPGSQILNESAAALGDWLALFLRHVRRVHGTGTAQAPEKRPYADAQR